MFSRLPLSVWSLALAMGIGMSSATIAVRIAAEFGEIAAGARHLATYPTGLQVVGVMIGGLICSRAMGRFGRKPVLLVGLGFGVLAGFIGVAAALNTSYALLFPAHFCLGLYLANIALLRFTAADQVTGPLSARALSLTLFGGVLAAFVGPGFVYWAGLISEVQIYAWSYGFIALISASVWLLIAATKIKDGATEVSDQPKAPIDPRTYMTRPYITAVLTGAVGYGVMSLLMTAAALYMKELNEGGPHAGHFGTNVRTFAIMWHVVAMFAPMVILPRIAGLVGLKNLMLMGCGLLALAALLNIMGAPTPFLVITSLITLGLGWAATYGAGGIMVKQVVVDEARFVAQGRNELMVSLFAGMGAVGAGPVLATLDWGAMNFAALILVGCLFPLIALLPSEKGDQHA